MPCIHRREQNDSYRKALGVTSRAETIPQATSTYCRSDFQDLSAVANGTLETKRVYDSLARCLAIQRMDETPRYSFQLDHGVFVRKHAAGRQIPTKTGISVE